MFEFQNQITSVCVSESDIRCLSFRLSQQAANEHGNTAGDGIDFDSEYFGSRYSDDGDDETSEILVYTKHQWQDAHNTSFLFSHQFMLPKSWLETKQSIFERK